MNESTDDDKKNDNEKETNITDSIIANAKCIYRGGLRIINTSLDHIQFLNKETLHGKVYDISEKMNKDYPYMASFSRSHPVLVTSSVTTICLAPFLSKFPNYSSIFIS